MRLFVKVNKLLFVIILFITVLNMIVLKKKLTSNKTDYFFSKDFFHTKNGIYFIY